MHRLTQLKSRIKAVKSGNFVLNTNKLRLGSDNVLLNAEQCHQFGFEQAADYYLELYGNQPVKIKDMAKGP